MALTHILDLLAGLGIMWVASGLVVRGVERFSKNTRLSTFASSLLLLGILTSLTEMSVGLNAVLEKKPSIFVGNLIGGSFVILLLIVPLLAIFNRGITLRHHLDPKRLLLFLILIAAPSIVTLDGHVGITDALIVLGLYALFLFSFQANEQVLDRFAKAKNGREDLAKNLFGIILGAVLIYIAGKVLVDKTVIISNLLDVPPLLVSLLVLSLGTNFPEAFVAIRAIRRRHAEIAFGDYIGSAATNAVLFAILTLLHGPFFLETSGFTPVFLIIMMGYGLFFAFARHKTRISPAEGLILLLIYVIFLLFQATEIATLSEVI